MSPRDDVLLALRVVEQKTCDDYCSGERDWVSRCPEECEEESPGKECPGRRRYLKDRETLIIEALLLLVDDQEIQDAVRRARQVFGRTPFDLMRGAKNDQASRGVQ